MTRHDPASLRQIEAADPGASTWLSANAGSGKTRVLTDRVARLLLDGVDPQRVLCLTYTKAAAAEMQNRLFRRLGAWSMLDDAALTAALDDLGADGPRDDDALRRARRLFARAIETPGGLRIQTIHSFCAALLRRFPLEAGLTPQFTEMDERTARIMREDALDHLAEHAPEPVAAATRHFTGESLEALAGEIARQRDRLDGTMTRDAALALFGLPAGFTAQALLADVFTPGTGAVLEALRAALPAGSPTDIKAARKLADLRCDDPGPDDLARLESALLTGKAAAEPFTAKIGRFPTKATRTVLGGDAQALDDIARRVEAARPRRLALEAAERTHALHVFAAAFLPEYERRKARAGWLDFDDLILGARRLLTEPGVADWVLFKLDGGVDHILVDEAQDTSPAQWDVIELLAREFTAGEGARDARRTIFVVGDKKQSIYSFQGADLRAFDRMRAQFAGRLDAVGVTLNELVLEHSFRSAPAILQVVDLTFSGGAGAGLGGEVHHLAYHGDMPGRVDLWPAVEPVAKPEDKAWYDPVDIVTDQHHTAQLAARIAGEIRRMIDARVPIPAEDGARPVREGDFLILVQRRSELFGEIIRACKGAGLEVAGADRLKIGGEMAVKDLTALLAFVATPEDDLSLAAALRSPLLGWSEGALFDLAHGREERYLWQSLRARAAEFPETLDLLYDLRDRAEFDRPYELIERILIRHGGRARLLARLGEEAEDGIDALLAQAHVYERTEVPSLTGFLTWLAAEEVEIKRQLDSAGNRIRVMTVHGAKGLESPVVILPDTARRNPGLNDELLELPAGGLVWKTAAAESPPALDAAREALRASREEENMRLLYVAMTRAEKWLIVCAAGEVGDGACWYDRVEAGLRTAGAAQCAFPFATGLRFEAGAWPEAAEVTPQAGLAPAAPPSLPPLGAVPETEAPLSPSDLGGAKALPGETAVHDTETALRRGRQLHRLLEYLPRFPAGDWARLAPEILATGEDAADPDTARALLEEARGVLDAPELAFLFAPGTLAEVEIAAPLGGRRMLGVIDRLAIAPDRVLAVDFKSNAVIPDRAEAVPEGLLRQMGAYGQALAAIYPDRPVATALLWTRGPRLMELPHDLVHRALSGRALT
ncbi:double-strand break repair helicase AddA [Rhodobacteraceae bacterium WD3A24]|nr:double-strand break repair helicase AddA [Rhodobacteraceae bacterium WD3A24]